MTIDLSSEKAISLAQACRDHISGYTGKPISPQTAYRWIKTGILAGDGTRVRLAAVKVGRNLVTTDLAIKRFFAELAAKGQVGPAVSHLAVRVQTNAELRGHGLISGRTSN